MLLLRACRHWSRDTRLIDFDVECEATLMRIELRTREDAPSQFEIIADVKEFDRIGMILVNWFAPAGLFDIRPDTRKRRHHSP